MATCTECYVTSYEAIRFTDSQVLEFMFSHGVLREVVRCGRCGNEVQLNRSTYEFRCQRKVSVRKQKPSRCGFIRSCRTGTFYERTHLSFRQVFDLVNVLVWLKPPRLRYIQLNIGISSRTVVDWYSYCREVFVDHSLRFSEALGGPGCIVEIDEAKFGKRKYNRGRRVEGQWVFGGVERGTGKSFMVPVETRDKDTLLDILKKWVLPGTTVHSDYWKAYNCLNDEGYMIISGLTIPYNLRIRIPAATQTLWSGLGGKSALLCRGSVSGRSTL